jgi:RNA-binding protein
MTDLTGKQKRFLRGRGQTLSPAAIIGKSGLTDEAVANIRQLITQHELVKIRLPEGMDRKALAAELAQRTDAELIGVIGRTCLLYIPNPDLPGHARLNLPR